jgi:hypothetical protein
MFGRRKDKAIITDTLVEGEPTDAPADDRERLPEKYPTDCRREACPQFGGVACKAYDEWMSGAATEGTEDPVKDKPPYVETATFIQYGTYCMSGAEPQLVAQHYDIFSPDEVDQMRLAVFADRYGEMPVTISTAERSTPIQTTIIASSED